jgi:hypothetical protein
MFRPTKRSKIYKYGTIIKKVLTNDIFFYDIKEDNVIIPKSNIPMQLIKRNDESFSVASDEKISNQSSSGSHDY